MFLWLWFCFLLCFNVDICRPELEAENVNEHLDLFVNSILSSINQSLPDLLDQLTTESSENEVTRRESLYRATTLDWKKNCFIIKVLQSGVVKLCFFMLYCWWLIAIYSDHIYFLIP